MRVVYIALVPVLAWACYRAEPSAAPCPKREAPAPTVVVTNVGCFRDQENRDLNGMMLEARDMTTEACTRECAEWGYRFAGAENGNQCFCGNAFGKYGASTDCTKPCVGRPDETCGGFWANSVYQVQRLEGAAPVASPVIIPVPPAQSVALAPPPPAPVPHDPDSHFTEAEVIERQPSIPLGAEWKPLPKVTRGTWWTEYVSQPQSVHDACAAAVASRFGEGWQLAGLHAYLGTATLVSRTNLADVLAEPARVARPTVPYLDMARRTRELFRRHADLFGLLGGDFPKFVWTVRYHAANVWIAAGDRATDPLPQSTPGKTPLLDAMGNPFNPGRSVAVAAMLDSDGVVLSMQALVGPEVVVGTRRPLTLAEARAYPGIVGAKLEYRGQSFGTLRAVDVASVEATVRQEEKDGTLRYELQHDVDLGVGGIGQRGMGGLPWHAWVEPDGRAMVMMTATD